MKWKCTFWTYDRYKLKVISKLTPVYHMINISMKNKWLLDSLAVISVRVFTRELLNETPVVLEPFNERCTVIEKRAEPLIPHENPGIWTISYLCLSYDEWQSLKEREPMRKRNVCILYFRNILSRGYSKSFNNFEVTKNLNGNPDC